MAGNSNDSILASEDAQNAYTMIGPVFVGNIVDWMLMGILIVQVYFYLCNFPKDRIAIRVLVYVISCLNVTQTVFGTHLGWWFMIKNWDRPDVLKLVPWTAATIPIVCSLIAAIVQTFYAWRIWKLTRTKITSALAILIVGIALAQCLVAIVSSSIVLTRLGESNAKNLARLQPEFAFRLAGSFAADVLISLSMIWVLYSAKVKSPWKTSDTLITRLIMHTIQTGSVTAVCAGVDLLFLMKWKETNYHLMPASILGELYSNSLMATLNGRKSQFSSTVSEQAATIRMQIQVSRDTQRRVDIDESGASPWPESVLPGTISSDNKEPGSSKDIGFDDPHVRVLRLNTPTPPSNSSRGEVDLHVV